MLNFLIADDSPINLKLLHVNLESEGHRVVEAGNGIEALAILDRQPVDAVISDILMPSMDGFRLCREIRTCAKSYSGIPLVLYTATYDSPADRALAHTVGADAFVLNPAPVAVLIGAVQDALRNQATRRITAPKPDEAYVLGQYNTALVAKLEARNGEVRDSLLELQSAHGRILELNKTLETRVAQRTAALDAANKDLEAFSYAVSHDLRAPLRRIGGFSQLLAESSSARLDDASRGMLTQIVGAAAQMDELIDALLDFGRMGRAELHLATVDLDALIDKAIADLQPESKGRIIEWHRAPLPKVRGDAVLLGQVLANLLSNAVKYSRTRDAATVDIGSRVGRDGQLVVFIRDNGVGFDLSRAGKLFGVFQRMHSTDEFEGLGIGLANAERIVTRHGGAIWAEAAPGTGATFYFSLPLA